MTDHRPFHFKHFSLLHHQSTMKVGTDAMLLGSWIKLNGTRQILDIGAGCGIISLILAQRCNASIDAVEIDEKSVNEANVNFEASCWHQRLKCYHSDIKKFDNDSPKKYDLIISNPPFFTSDLKTKTAQRNLARHTDSLDFKSLIQSVKSLLSSDGRFALVLPIPEAQLFIKLAKKENIFLTTQREIFSIEGKSTNRWNLIFSFTKPQNIEFETFIIKYIDGNYTETYKLLLKDFYLGL